MAKILSNNEIDALFADSGGAAAVAEAGATSAAAPASQTVSKVQAGKNAKTFDFTKPNRLSQDQIQGLWRIYEQLASRLQQSLASMLRLNVRVELMDLEQIRYETLLEDLPSPLVSVVLEARDSGYGGLVCLENSLAYVLLERLLGGATNSKAPEDPRPLTPLECAALDGMITVYRDELERAWEGVAPLELKITSYESNVQYVQVIPRKEVVVAATFGLGGELPFGEVRLLLPHLLLEPYLEGMSRQSPLGGERRPATPSGRVRLARSLADSRLDVTMLLGRSQLPMGDISQLRVGDVIPLGKSADAPLELQIAGLTKFLGQAIQRDGAWAFNVDEVLAPPDELRELARHAEQEAGRMAGGADRR